MPEMELDCGIVMEDRVFRYRAAAVICRDRQILMATNPSVNYLYSIGGAVHLGETSIEAVTREVEEETGIRMRVSRLLFIHENFFTEPCAGRPRAWHEIALYYSMEPKQMDLMRAGGVSMNGDAEQLVWVPYEDFMRINAYPGFLPEILQKEEGRVWHVVSRDDQHRFL